MTEINRYVPRGLEDSITNTVRISGNGVTDITVKETVYSEAGARRTITKSCHRQQLQKLDR